MTTPAAELLALGAATVYEASRLDCALPSTLRPAWPGAAIAGPALPVRTAPADNLPLHLALEAASAGEVLVVDGCGAACGYWGEILTVAAQQRGITGLVIDGGVRDIDRLAELAFPVFSTTIAIPGTVKNDPGTIASPITIGTVTVARGDIIVADSDGVVVVPQAKLTEVLAASHRRHDAELAYLTRIRAGEQTADIYNLRTPIKQG
jgi:4-hydroxy-4-methyl-2-oxoglutarate aldolase